MDELSGKHADLTISKPDALYRIAHALASPVRIRIMQELGIHTLSVGELAQALDIPMSTAALSVKILEEAGIITTETQPGVRGVVKLCSRRLDTLAIALAPEDEQRPSSLTLQMPIGGYSAATDIQPTCGLANDNATLGDMDRPSAFYMPDRFGAQLIKRAARSLQRQHGKAAVAAERGQRFKQHFTGSTGIGDRDAPNAAQQAEPRARGAYFYQGNAHSLSLPFDKNCIIFRSKRQAAAIYF